MDHFFSPLQLRWALQWSTGESMSVLCVRSCQKLYNEAAFSFRCQKMAEGCVDGDGDGVDQCIEGKRQC